MKKEESFERKPRLTATERAERKSLVEIEAKAAMAEHEREQKRLRQNRERLKAERLAREATPEKK